MTDQAQAKPSDDIGKIINPVVVAVAGAVVGAGIAVAGAALSDKKNREKVIKIASTVKDGVTDYVERTHEQAEVQKKVIKQKIFEDKEKLNKVVKLAKNSIHRTSKEVNNIIKSI